MAEYVVDDASYVNVVPPTLRAVAVLVEPATKAAKAYAQVVKLQQRLPWVNATYPAWPLRQGHRRHLPGA
jgi:hypothetical protein